MSIMTMELIERLRQHADTFAKSGFAVDGLVNDYREAADTIQLLSEKLHNSQTEPCEDAISRKAALECFDMTNTRPGAKHAIETLPPVRPKSEDAKFLEFLTNTINPNEMEQYIAMYHGKEEKANG